MPEQEKEPMKESSVEHPNIFAALSDFVWASERCSRYFYTDDGSLKEGLDTEEQDRETDEFDKAIKAVEASGATEFDINHAWLEGALPAKRQSIFDMICELQSMSFGELQVIQDRYGLKQPSFF